MFLRCAEVCPDQAARVRRERDGDGEVDRTTPRRKGSESFWGRTKPARFLLVHRFADLRVSMRTL